MVSEITEESEMVQISGLRHIYIPYETYAFHSEYDSYGKFALLSCSLTRARTEAIIRCEDLLSEITKLLIIIERYAI